MTENKPINWKGRFFLILFALPFAGVGAFAGGYIAWSFYDFVQMKDWVEVPCKILQAELVTNSDSDSTTYKVTARYEYAYDGNKFTGDRVGINNSSEKIGSYHEEKADELKQYQRTGNLFRCFVNPSQPNQAVLYPELRIAQIGFLTIFVLIFGGVGCGLIFWSFYSIKIERRENELQAAHAGQPWMWKEDWAAGEIKSSNKKNVVGAFCFAAFWNLISGPVIFIVPDEIKKENYPALIALLFPAVGLGLLIWFFILLLRWRKYGDSYFTMASVPGVIGGQLAGVVQTKVKLRPEDGFQVNLSCIEKVTSGSGKNRSTSEKIRWQDEKVLSRELTEHDVAQSAIPIQFQIPYDAPETTVEEGSGETFWRLKVQAAVPGIDYLADFKVPVFKTPDSSPDFKPDETVLVDYEVQLDDDDIVRAAGIRLEPTPGGRRFIFPMARNPGGASGLTIFFTIWCGAIWLMIHMGAPILFPILFGLFAVLIFLGVLDLWLWSSMTEVRYGTLRVRTGLFGIGKTWTYAVDQIQTIKAESGMQSGNRLYYMLRLYTTDGKKHTLGKGLRNQSDANRIVEMLMESLT